MLKNIEEGIYLYDTGKKGNTTTIMVGVHGNEYSGIQAMEKIKNEIKLDNGKVYFIYANLRAIKENVRFTEKNLNRCFLRNQDGTSYEEKRAKTIMKYLDKSDFLLDVHNTTSYINSLKVLITTHIDYAKYFDIKNVMSNIDDVQKGGSDGYMDSIGKKGFCLECGSINYKDEVDIVDFAYKAIMNFLKVTKNIEQEAKIYNKDRLVVKMYFGYKTETDKFILAKDFADFEEIKKGDLIAIDGEEKIYCKKDSIIVFAHNRKQVGSEGFYLGEKI